MDCVAGANLGPCLETMVRGGRWIVIATLGGSKSELNMTDFFKRGIKLIGSTLRSRTSEMKAQILAGLEQKTVVGIFFRQNQGFDSQDPADNQC